MANTIELLKEAGKLPADYGCGRRNQLPVPGTMYGREAALHEALQLLAQDRRLCIVAAQIAHSLFVGGQLAGGAYRIDLQDYNTSVGGS